MNDMGRTRGGGIVVAVNPGMPPPAGADWNQVAPGVFVFMESGLLVEGRDGWGGLGWYPDAADSPGVAVAKRHLEELLAAWRGGGPEAPADLEGGFACLLWGSGGPDILGVTDPFRTRPLFYARSPEWFACATRLSLLADHGLLGECEIDPVAIYHYLNFSYLPTPFTPFRAARKAPAGAFLRGRPGSADVRLYYDPSYPEDLAGTERALAGELRREIIATVGRFRPRGDRWGAFLSGGTDSSSICGILATGQPAGRVRAFSIGFEEAGWDELRYVEIAARSYGLDSRTKRVGADESLAALPRLAAAFDEPFGNSSAIATHACAAFARTEGVDVLVAGDGGDEIFGGNERYRKDRILGLLCGSPAPARAAARAVAERLAGIDRRWANRVKNFVRRGLMPNPDRFYADDAFASEHFEDLLAPDFRAQLARDASLDLMRDVYRQAVAPTEIHRLMYLDLRMCISDNDLVKVTTSSRLAGVEPVFPYLDRSLVDFTGRLPGWAKLKGLNKRQLFKRAMQGVLPAEIITKKKQGFGVPVSLWIREHHGFQELVGDLLLSRAARERGYYQSDHVAALLDRHGRGVWDHGQEIYLLLMLELWHREQERRRVAVGGPASAKAAGAA
jgi:asparagine synthase (glutamine-hydrolysing)